MNQSAVPILHMRGTGLVGGRIAGSQGMLLWVWTLLALSMTAAVAAVLAASGLWRLRRTGTQPGASG